MVELQPATAQLAARINDGRKCFFMSPRQSKERTATEFVRITRDQWQDPSGAAVLETTIRVTPYDNFQAQSRKSAVSQT